MDKNTEIRHLPANIREILAQRLENSWEILMEGIPKELAQNNDVDFVNNFSKYSPDQINLIHTHCTVHKVNFPALVLFDEWGSSGKIRPTLGHLVKILSKLQLFWAADYLCTLINEPRLIRPSDGPAAEIHFTSFEEELPSNTSGTYGENRNNPDDNNKNYSNQNKVELPAVRTDSASDLIRFDPSTFVRTHHIENTTTNRVAVHSNYIHQREMIDETLAEAMIPAFSALVHDNSNESSIMTKRNTSATIMPDLTGLLERLPSQIVNDSMDFTPVPNLSAFHDSDYSLTNMNGYGEVENIPFSDIQSATENFNDRRKLGEGGFSTVYLAINLRTSFKYSAIKRIHTNYAKSAEHFTREIELLKNVDHQNLIKLLGYSSSQPDEMCFVYEYINGGNLFEKLENCRLDKDHLHWKDRINIARGCSEGIKYLHSNIVNIIHRDIKSSNILLDGTTPKICDFGFVKNANFNTTTMAVGTNAYMAPETVRGNVSIAVDIFAFGVVILELVSGFNVLDNSKPNEIIDLVTYFETSLKQPDYHITFTDKRAGDWKHLNHKKTAAEELLELARKCLLSKSDRLEILELNLGLTKIYNDYCT